LRSGGNDKQATAKRTCEGVAESVDRHWSFLLVDETSLVWFNLCQCLRKVWGIGSYLMQCIKELKMQKKLVAALAAGMMMTVPALGIAAMAGANTVNSAAIVDGSVATADIANLAVTTAKIANNAVTATQIATGAVGNTALAAGAVTDAKITGPISTSKLIVGTTAGTVAAGNHTHDASYSKKYANVIVVATSGGDFTSPIQAVNSITTASASNPYLVKIMPGVYDLGTAPLQMKPHIDVEGSGQENTIITSSRTNADFDTCTVGTVQMANNTWLKNIKVMNTAPDAGNDNLTAGVIFDNVTANMEAVKVLIGTDTSFGARNAGACSTGSLALATLNNVDLETHTSGTGHSNAAMIIHESSMIITNSKLSSFSEAGSIHTVDCCSSDTEVGFTKVSNSTITGTCLTPDCGNEGFWVDQCRTSTLRDSIVTLTGGNNGDYISAKNDVSIFNSQFYGSVSPFMLMSWNNGGGGIVKIANSLLQGDMSNIIGAPDVKLFNNFNEILTAIPNQ
jgi:hypothetical protein